MKAVEAKLLDFLKKSPQFIIPIYQRNYSWTEKECMQLWEDILRTGQDDRVKAHFIGSIVYVERGLYSVSSQSALLVIDGQQRLTTMTLLLTALSEQVGAGEPFDGFTQRKIRNYYLVNPEEEGNESYYKLLLSETDKASLIALLDGKKQPTESSIRIVQNYQLFKDLLANNQEELSALCQGIVKLMLVDISLDRQYDNPQLIFESMNSTGKALSQADLIRNYILMGLEHKLQTRLYTEYWRPMETNFGQAAYTDHFDGFMRHYLTFKTRDIPNIRQVYEAFKLYAQNFQGETEGLVADIKKFADYYCAMALGNETDQKLSEVFYDLRELKVSVAYPLLLELYDDYQSKVLSRDDFVTAARMIESYVFRRTVCALPTNSMNKTFAQFGRKLRKSHYLESIQAEFLLQTSYRRFPTDEEFKRELQIRDLYNFRNRGYWLRRLENFERKERVAVDEYTIEHIMPQTLSEQWKSDLGDQWKTIHSQWLHTLGNLTLTGYNSEYRNYPFLTKRDMEGGFKLSPLKVNQMTFLLDDQKYNLGSIDVWNEASIQARATALAEQLLTVWAKPALDEHLSKTYQNKNTHSTYSIADHPYLKSDLIKKLFDTLRQEIMALDPSVTEEFLKLYIAYKAETNFVDVVPQAKRLRLTLNMKFAEVNDPRKICKDTTDLGHWGNGDVEVGLESLDDLPYIMSLIRQSFEKQLSSEFEV
ncbi:GmrSD restriction endonuclease domain-containing protein [Thiolinea disciformis]|uniref:GmrSD restriction endonuclease domain-containing protein n=1 Tax=Thiolinea disciformis TaxID=125614 RepID=UPI00035C242B|nr:DUF262 domain-containing protein [Thiolinea disciformis]